MGPQPCGGQGNTQPRVEPGALEDFVARLFVRTGLPEQDAREVSGCLAFAELRGIASHGVSRVPIYIRRLRLGLVNARPRIRVERTGSSTAVVDGDNGMGPVVGLAGMRTALDLARQTGVGVVAVRCSNHFGAGAYYVYEAVRHQCIGVALSNAPPTMAPWGGREPLLGTNPVAVAVPAGSHPPVVLDMATSVVARGRIILAAQRGESIPEGWALDPSGRPTIDADAALKGCVLPFGGAKGQGIAILTDLLSGVLSGAAFGRRVGDLYENLSDPQNVGHFFMALDPRRFMPLADFLARVDRFIDDIKACLPAQGFSEVVLPGELEERLMKTYANEGIPLEPRVLATLQELAETLGVDSPQLVKLV